MQFKPEEISVENLIKTYPTFIVPSYQRDYTWDRYDYNKFLEDIINGIVVNEGELKTTPYFIGTMVFAGEKDDENIEVVDGQQRLTVITILLSVISEKLSEMKEKELSDLTFKFVKEIDKNNNQIKHLESKTSYPYLDLYVQSREKLNIPVTRTEEEENIKRTYDYFYGYLQKEKIANKFTKIYESDFLKIILAIRNQILESKVITILTKDKKSAFMIFEILNSKGKKLASIDLIKNSIFEVIGTDTGQSGLAEEKWDIIKENLRLRDNNIGIDTFYRHYWLSKYKKVTSSKLYDSFKDYIHLNNQKDCINFLVELEQASELYIKIVSPIDDDYDRRKEYKWLVESLRVISDTFSSVQSRVALLGLLKLKEDGLISTSSLKKSIYFIKEFLFAYSGVMSGNPNIYESRFSKLSIELRKSSSKANTNDILSEYLYDNFKDRIPTYLEFEENFIQLEYSKKRLQTNLITKYAINQIYKHIQKEECNLQNGTIEHIINEDEDNNITLKIGNLMLLESKLNEEASNLSVEEKIEIYNKSSYIGVKKFTLNNEDFLISEITERSKKLAKYYYDNLIEPLKGNS